MNDRPIRAAIALYPPEWRGRYGAELEQVTVEACEAASGSIGRARLLLGVAACGLQERTRRRLGRYGATILGVVATTAAAIAAVLVFFVGNPTLHGLLKPPTPDTLAAKAHVDPQYTATPATDAPSVYSGGRPEILLGSDPVDKNVVGVRGPPVIVKLNPKNDEVTSVRERRH